MRNHILILFMATAIGASCFAQQKTMVVVRAKARDAKLIGTSMGGAMISIKNAQTGEVLAKGLTEGGTGNTEKLVLSPKKRYETLTGEGDAKFTAELMLEKPVFVTISATGPYGHDQARATSSTQLWLIPGKDIIGDGVVLEIPGFVVDILKPTAKQSGKTFPIKAKVVMMCGCPTKPGGTWDSSGYDISALIYRNGEKLESLPLGFSGETSVFEGSYSAAKPGDYTIKVYAYHAKTGNTGLDEVGFSVE